MIKPTSADCNLACTYCFYLPKAGLYPQSSRHRMSDSTLKHIISKYMATDQDTYSFGWQGGEPTLMGVDFFRNVVDLQSRCGRPGSIVANGLQTNATLITDELARLLAEYHFLLGVSLDGPEEIHNTYRKNLKGTGSYKRVIEGIGLLKKHHVEFNILIAVNAANVEKAREIYNFLLDLDIRFHQYIPIVEFDDQGGPLPFSVDGSRWGAFLKELFEIWYPDSGRVSVRLFDAILTYLVEGSPILCTMGEDCRQYFLVEYNGDIYPCDFFASPELRLGNVLDTDWNALLESPGYRVFGEQKSDWNEICASCAFLKLCMGDCLKHRFYGAPGLQSDPRRLSWLCSGWKDFYQTCLPAFQRIARRIQRQRSRELNTRLASSAIRSSENKR
ncbi:MAG: anaerobic sulfatase maturase [Spirochaetaceae bacterium]|nr:MAG: anaerobic sulfatase maturase [Spirochaetaceae bacterium]